MHWIFIYYLNLICWSSFEYIIQLFCQMILIWICFYKRDCYVRSATQKYVISKRKLNFESMTHTKSANVVVTINTICSFMKKTLICPIHIWFNPQWSLKNTLVPMSGVQLLKFRGSQLKSTKANIWFCFIFQERLYKTPDCSDKVAW